MTSTWNDVRRNLSDRLNRSDYADMQDVRAGKAWRTTSGKDMVRIRLKDGHEEDRPRSWRKLRRLGMVPEIKAGDYSLTPDGDVALDSWLAKPATYPVPTEGPSQ